MRFETILNSDELTAALNKFAAVYVPSEKELFEDVWRITKDYCGNHPHLFRAPSSSPEELAQAVGFARVSGSDLKLLRIVGVVVNSLVVIGSAGGIPSDSEVEEVVGNQADLTGLPKNLVSPLKELMIGLVKAKTLSLTAHDVPRRRSAGGATLRFEVIEVGRPYTTDSAGLQLLRQRKNEFDIWVDDTVPEILARGKGITLVPGESDVYLTLLRLLEKVGSSWTTEDLFLEGTCNNPDPGLTVESDPSDLVRKRVIYLKRVLSAVLPQEELETWLPRGARKRIDVKTNLKTCLVRRRGP